MERCVCYIVKKIGQYIYTLDPDFKKSLKGSVCIGKKAEDIHKL